MAIRWKSIACVRMELQTPAASCMRRRTVQRAMGYNRVVTYILDTENGSSLKAAGYTCEGRAGGLEWNGAKAPKQADQYPRQMKTRWVKKKEGLHGS